MEERSRVQDAACDIFNVQACEAVRSAQIATDASQDRMRHEPCDQVQVETCKSVVDRDPVPVLGDLFPALLIDEFSVFLIDTEETGEDLLGCDLLAMTTMGCV